MGNDAQKTILVAGVGLSPAVLTNTVWALAHERIPTVVVITTGIGRKVFAALADMLLPSMKQRGNHLYPFEKITVREVS